MGHFEKNFHWGRITNYSKDDNKERFDWNGWSLRLGWHQVALWHNYDVVINWLTPWSDRLYTSRKGLYFGRQAIIQYGS